MTPAHGDPELMIGIAGTFRRVPLSSLAAVTHLPLSTLRDSLAGLVFALFDHNQETAVPTDEGEPTEGDGSQRYGPALTETVPTVPGEKYRNGSGTVGTVPTEPSDAHECEAPSSTPSDLSAESIAVKLDDATNLPFYRTLVASTAPALIRLALDETLSRRDHLRGPAGAYFTAIIRRLTRTNPYARTPPPTL